MPPETAEETLAGTQAATTPEGGEQAAATPAQDTRSPREIQMDQIAAQNELRINEEHVERGLAPVVVADGAAAATPATDANADQVAAQLADGDRKVLDNLDNVFIKVKVDGKEEVVPASEVALQYQKGTAADKRLTEASRLFKEAKAASEAATAAAAAAAKPPIGVAAPGASADITTQSAPAEDTAAKAKQTFVQAMFDGDAEAAMKAFDEALTAGRQAPTPPDQLATQVATQVKQQLSVESALEQFGKDNPDIVSDPYLETLTAGFIEQEMKDGKNFIEALVPAAKQTRDWLASKVGSPAPSAPPTTDRNQKLERKEGIDNVQALHTKATTAEERVPTPSDVIAEMREKRGLN